MSLLNFLHTYIEGGLIKSSDWDDEFNQILATFGYTGILNPNKQIIISCNDNSNPVLLLDNLTTGDILQLTDVVNTSLFKNNGQILIGVNGIVGFIINSSVKCPNLNADLLDGKHSTDLETKLNSFQFYRVFYNQFDLSNNFLQPSFVVGKGGCLITKLKAQQPEVASADASSIFTVKKNGNSIGTISIAGNTQALQTNDIGDVSCVENDIITIERTTYSGTTKHFNITVGFNYKKNYTI